MLFGPSFNKQEREIWDREMLSLMMHGMPRGQAKKEARDKIQEAISTAKSRKTYGEPPLGEARLREYKMNGWDALAAEGVTEQDVLDWWNMEHVERELLLIDDEQARMGTFLSLLTDGETSEKAGRTVWKSFAMFGDYPSPSAPAFEDDPSSYPLPYELKDRVNRWIEAFVSGGGTPDLLKARVTGHGTFNGYIRHLIQSGEFDVK